MRALMGSFHLLPLGELVDLLARRAVSGELSCERGSVKKKITLASGVAVGAASNDPREYLGQLLINFGHLDEEQLAKAFETQQETKVKLGRVLAMVGLVEPAVVRETLALKIRETLLDVFVWENGYFTFDEGEPPAPDELDGAVPLPDIAKEAEFRTTAWEAFRSVFPSGGATLAIDEARTGGVDSRSVDGRVLALARQGRTIDEMGLAMHATDFHLYQRLYALQRQGVLRPLPAGTAETPTAEHLAAPELLRRARQAMAARRALEAEGLAARAVELAPQDRPAAEVLALARQALSSELRTALLVPPRVPVLRLRPEEVALLRLSSAEKYLLGRCDGARDVARLAKIAPLPELEVLKAIRRFADARIVELHELGR
jgi:hypothetical protein